MKEKKEFLGEFIINKKIKSYGKIAIDNDKTNLLINIINPPLNFGELMEIKGELSNLKKVTCIEPVVNNISKNIGDNGECSCQLSIFSHFVIIGKKHLDISENNILSITFTTQDIDKVFFDSKSFGKIIHSKEIELIINNSKKEDIKISKNPVFFYFSGQLDLLKIKTSTGMFKLSNRPIFLGQGRNGEFLRNTMTVSLEFPSLINFDECITRTLSLIRFLNILAGREQSIQEVKLNIANDISKLDEEMELHWSNATKESDIKGSSPHYGDIPIRPLENSKEFKKVIVNWLGHESTRRAARVRYNSCSNKGSFYNIDRLVAAANMFDILSKEELPSLKPLSNELINARDECKKIFSKLNQTPERDIILGALGRMDKPSLTSKVLFRADFILKEIGHIFPDLPLVIKTAIKVRNYFVHGSNELNYEKIESLIPFLTDSLEFTFAASDLIECGWNAKEWASNNYGLGHGFTCFRHSYKENIELLKESLKK